MKRLALLALLIGCSEEPEGLSEKEQRRQEALGRINNVCIAWAANIRSADFLATEAKCEREKKEIEAKKKSFMATVPAHLKDHVKLPFQEHPDSCYDNLFKQEDMHKTEEFVACASYLINWKLGGL